MNYVKFQRSADKKAELPRQPGSGFGNAENLTLATDALVRMSELGSRAAAGDAEAASFLLGIAFHSTTELTALSQEKPSMLKVLAKRVGQWPVLGSRHPENEEANRCLFQMLQLGTETDISATEKSRWQRTNPFSQYAMDAIQVIKSNRMRYKILGGEIPPWVHAASRLPELSKATAKEWWKVGKLALLEAYPKPEQIAELKKLAIESRGEFESDATLRRHIMDCIGRALEGIAGKKVLQELRPSTPV